MVLGTSPHLPTATTGSADSQAVDVSWVPERHLEVIATLAHVEDEMQTIHRLIYEHQRDRESALRLQEQRTALVNRIVVKEIKPIPAALPRLVADSLFGLRAAIEHALFTEAEHLNGGPLSDAASRLVEMPCCDKPETFQNWLNKNKKVRPDSIAHGGELVPRIEALQPYRAVSATESHPLKRLAHLTNQAKHRSPVSIGMAVPVTHRLDDEVNLEDALRGNRPKTPVKVGDTVFQTFDRGRVEIDVFPALVIQRAATDEWVLLSTELNDIDSWVRDEAVPRMITGTDPQGRKLPVHYDTMSGHMDQRAAISVGTTRKSWQVYRDRFGATASRESFAEWFSEVAAAPGRAAVVKWLDSLSDAEVIERVSQLTPGKGYRLARQNYEVLSKLGEEASRFRQSQEQSEHK